MKVAVVFDTWKKPIFERHFLEANITDYKLAYDAPAGTIGWVVVTDTPQDLMQIIKNANKEAATTKKGSPDAN